jgi:putative addiction module component (TIGR02574 family)
MVAKNFLDEALSLSPVDREELAERLWESLANEPGAFRLTSAQKAELDRRIDEYEKDPNSVSSWEEVETRIQAKL